MLIRYRQPFRYDSIWRMLVASLVGAPLGGYFLSRIEEKLALLVLRLVITGYAFYALIGFRLPELTHPFWAWITGMVSGMLGGAYNTPEPPVVIYGNCRSGARMNSKATFGILHREQSHGDHESRH